MAKKLETTKRVVASEEVSYTEKMLADACDSIKNQIVKDMIGKNVCVQYMSTVMMITLNMLELHLLHSMTTEEVSSKFKEFLEKIDSLCNKKGD